MVETGSSAFKVLDVVFLSRTSNLSEVLIALWVHSLVTNRVFFEIDGGTSIWFYPYS